MKEIKYNKHQFERVIYNNYDSKKLSKQDFRILITEFIHNIEEHLKKLPTEKERIGYLASRRLMAKSAKFYNDLGNNKAHSNGFTENISKWLTDNIEYHSELNEIEIKSGIKKSSQKNVNKEQSYPVAKGNLELLDYAILHTEISKIHKLFLSENFIKKIDLKTFDSVFSSKPKGQIIWIDSQSTLSYFIKKLDVVLVESQNRYVNAKSIFVNRNLEPFKNLLNPGTIPPKKKQIVVQKAIDLLSKTVGN